MQASASPLDLMKPARAMVFFFPVIFPFSSTYTFFTHNGGYLGDVDLDRGGVLGGDESVSGGALSGDVKINNLLLVVLHLDDGSIG